MIKPTKYKQDDILYDRKFKAVGLVLNVSSDFYCIVWNKSEGPDDVLHTDVDDDNDIVRLTSINEIVETFLKGK